MKSLITNQQIKNSIELLLKEIQITTETKEEQLKERKEIKQLNKEEALKRHQQQNDLISKGNDYIQWMETILSQIKDIQLNEMKYNNEIETHINCLIDKEIDELNKSYQEQLSKLQSQKLSSSNSSSQLSFPIPNTQISSTNENSEKHEMKEIKEMNQMKENIFIDPFSFPKQNETKGSMIKTTKTSKDNIEALFAYDSKVFTIDYSQDKVFTTIKSSICQQYSNKELSVLYDSYSEEYAQNSQIVPRLLSKQNLVFLFYVSQTSIIGFITSGEIKRSGVFNKLDSLEYFEYENDSVSLYKCNQKNSNFVYFYDDVSYSFCDYFCDFGNVDEKQWFSAGKALIKGTYNNDFEKRIPLEKISMMNSRENPIALKRIIVLNLN